MTMTTNGRRGRGGFTLIELLVVIAIIGIFASISLVAMVTYREKAQSARVEQEVASFQKAAAVYFATNQRYPNPLSASNDGAACLTPINGAPQKCCISEGGCSYSGESLETLAGDGDFAAAPRAPRWLALLGTRAEAVLGGTLPRWLTEAPVSEGGNFQGVFYDCTDEDCGDAMVYFSVPKENCSRGTVHNGLDDEGICEQNITGANVGGDSSDEY
jgi:prepilin-type N-terminal cleavage/methylation domain-containing protein